MLTDGFSVLLVEAGLLTGQRSQREDSEPQLHVHITVVLIHSKTNTLPTVPSHTLDDSAAIRTEPGPRSLLPELPASPPRNTSVDPNSPGLVSSSLSLGSPFAFLAAKQGAPVQRHPARIHRGSICPALGFITCAFHHLVNTVVMETSGTSCTATTTTKQLLNSSVCVSVCRQ